jgi:hypothetical protein
VSQWVHGSVSGSKVGTRHFNFYHRAVNPFSILLSKVISGQTESVFNFSHSFLVYEYDLVFLLLTLLCRGSYLVVP